MHLKDDILRGAYFLMIINIAFSIFNSALCKPKSTVLFPITMTKQMVEKRT